MGVNQQSVVLLLGAKSRHRPLPAIPEELSTLKSILEAHQTEDLPQYQIKYEPFFTQKNLKIWLDSFADRIAILHFAGHSDPTSIQTDDSLVRAGDIAAHIKTWTRRPGLVFLNGCANKSQAHIFLDAGVSAVVATQRAVDDRQAANFAQEFYHSLLAQNGNTSLTAALGQAKAKLSFDKSDESRSSDVDEAGSWNWELFLKDTDKARLSLLKLLTLNRPQYDTKGELINPYQGLAAFKEEDRDFFFGREQLTEQLATTIDQTPFLALLGSSGSGKSSLINAGIIPRLCETKDYLIFKTRPGNDPFAEMARCVAEYLHPKREQLDQRIQQSDTLTEKFQRNPEYFSELLQTCLKDSDQRRLVLFIDQFEELFTHTDSEAAKEAVKQYEIALAELVATASGSITVVLAMRADFLGTALLHKQLATLLDKYSRHTKYLSPMSSAELRLAILEPADKQGVSVEDGLANQLLSELETNNESLPLLQHVLSLVWQSRHSPTLKLSDYTRLGGIEKALETQADQFLEGLGSDKKRDEVKLIFLRLINLGESHNDTRRRAEIIEFDSNPEIETLVQQLAEQRLITTQGDSSKKAFVEISHEALISSWGRLKEWINESRNELRIQHQISKAAKDWKDHNEDNSWLLNGSRLEDAKSWLENNESIAIESEKTLIARSLVTEKKKKSRVRYITTAIITLLSAFAIFAVFQWDIAVKEKLAANYNLVKAYEQKSLLSISQGNDLSQDNPFNPSARDEYRNALLYALEAQKHPLPEGKTSIAQTSMGYVTELQNSTLISPKIETPRLNLGGINVIAYSPNGRIIASGSTDKKIRLWDSKSGQALQAMEGHTKAILALDYSPNGKFIASGSADNTIRLWDSGSFISLKTFKGHSRKVITLTYSPDGKFIASGSADKTIRLWDAETFKHIKTLKGHSDDILALAYSLNGKLIASGSADNTIRLWNTQTFENVKTIKGHTDKVHTLAFNPHNNILASGSADNTIQFWSAESFDHIKTLNPDSGSILALDYRSDGKIIASGSTDRNIRLWDTQKFELINTLKSHSGAILTLAYSSNDKIIASGSVDNTIRFSNPITGEVTHTSKGHSRTILELAYHPEGKIFASASSDNTIQIWNAKSLKHIETLKGHHGYVRTVAFSPNGKTIASGSDDSTVSLWDARSFKQIKVFKGHTSAVLKIAYSPNNKVIASGSKDKTIRFWSTQSLQPIKTLEPDTGPIQALTYSPDGKVIASGSDDNNIRLWNTRTFENIHIIKGHTEDILTLAYSPNGEVLASGSNDDTIKLWNTKSFENIRTLRGHTSYILTVTFSPDGRTLASGSDDKTIRLWDAKTGEVVGTLNGLSKNNRSDAVLTLAYSPHGKDLISGSADSAIRLWNAKFMHNPNRLIGHSKTILAIAYSPDSKVIASGSNDNTIRLWNAQSGKVIQSLKGHSKAVFALSYSPDGKIIASGSSDKTIRLWDAHSGELINILKGHSKAILTLNFSPDGKLLVSGSADSAIKIWNTQSHEEVKTLNKHPSTVLTLAFSPDKRFFASGSADNTILLWDAQTFKHLGTFKGHSRTVLTLAFSNDSKMIASGSSDNTIRLWEVQNFKHIKTLEGHSGSIRSLGYNTSGELISASDDNTVRFWNTQSFKNIETLEEHSGKFKALAYSPDGKTLASGYDNNSIRIWRLSSPMFRFVHDFKALEVSGALRFLWELELEDLKFKHTARPQSLIPQMSHHIAWTDKTRKYRPLLDMPKGENTKMDQLVRWLEKRCAYKHPERYGCTPTKN